MFNFKEYIILQKEDGYYLQKLKLKVIPPICVGAFGGSFPPVFLPEYDTIKIYSTLKQAKLAKLKLELKKGIERE